MVRISREITFTSSLRPGAWKAGVAFGGVNSEQWYWGWRERAIDSILQQFCGDLNSIQQADAAHLVCEYYQVASIGSFVAKYQLLIRNRRSGGMMKRPDFFYAVSPWCESASKRGLDIFGAILLLITLSPLMIAVAVLVKLTSRGPVLFRQRRPGKNGREFTVLKFRTMIDGRYNEGPVLTRATDPRVTPFGRFIRKWKLDEFPQLFNVLRGEMSFVGPRPQPTKLWQQPSIQEEAACVFFVRPGITSQVTVKFRNEEELLAPFSAEQVEDVYMSVIMPVKIKMDLEYLESASFVSDFRVILKTIFRIFNRQEGENDFLIREYLPVSDERKLVLAAEQREYLSVAEEAD